MREAVQGARGSQGLGKAVQVLARKSRAWQGSPGLWGHFRSWRGEAVQGSSSGRANSDTNFCSPGRARQSRAYRGIPGRGEEVQGTPAHVELAAQKASGSSCDEVVQGIAK